MGIYNFGAVGATGAAGAAGATGATGATGGTGATGAYVPTAEATLTDAATIAWDLSANGPAAKVTLAGNRTLDAPSNMVSGASYALRVIQDGTGSRTLAYHATYKFPGGTDPVLSTGAGAIDVLTFYCDGTNMHGAIQKAFG